MPWCRRMRMLMQVDARCIGTRRAGSLLPISGTRIFREVVLWVRLNSFAGLSSSDCVVFVVVFPLAKGFSNDNDVSRCHVFGTMFVLDYTHFKLSISNMHNVWHGLDIIMNNTGNGYGS
jgi:hypothetical protein